jgi:dolichol-phosphate mannosyltransferase
VLFRRRLAGISDPMSGFFAIRRNLVQGRALHPTGYKILLELAVRCAPSRIAEVPYAFQPRFAGESKASLREGWRFLRHVAMLRLDATHARMIAFGLIGLSGFLPNLVTLNLLLHHTRIGVLLGEVIANQGAIGWNFALLDLVLFRRRRSRHWSGRIGAFLLLANADLVVRIPLLAVLVRYTHLGSLTATVLTLIAAFGIRFLVTDRAIYTPVKVRIAHRDPVVESGAAP